MGNRELFISVSVAWSARVVRPRPPVHCPGGDGARHGHTSINNELGVVRGLRVVCAPTGRTTILQESEHDADANAVAAAQSQRAKRRPGPLRQLHSPPLRNPHPPPRAGPRGLERAS